MESDTTTSEDKQSIPLDGKATTENLSGLPRNDLIDFALRAQALTVRDSLTGLFTKHFFEEEVAKYLERHNSSGVLLVIGVDCFKLVNSKYGHHVGDCILLKIANHVRSIVRPTDLVGRFGRGEFIVFFPDMASRTVSSRATEILNGVEQMSRKDNRIPSVSVSIGVAVVGESRSDIDPFKVAVFELYNAEGRGGNQISPESL